MSSTAVDSFKGIGLKVFSLLFKDVWEWTGVSRYIRQRRTEDTLLAMSDYQLWDIGLNRYEVAALVQRLP